MTTTIRHDPAAEFCSRFSQASEDDPIGSARIARHHVFIEVPFPWPKPFTEAAAMPPRVNEVIADAQSRGTDLKVLGLKPEEAHSQPGMTRLMIFSRPKPPIEQLTREEYLLPSDRVAELLQAWLATPTRSEAFEVWRVDADSVRDLMVCTHGSTDACCGTFGFPIYSHLRDTVAPRLGGALRVWRTSHTGGHRFAPTMLDFPEGRYWGHLTRNDAETIATREGPVERVYHAYRGWSALGSFEQLVEREALLQEGWSWLDMQVSARTLAGGREHIEPAWLGELDGGNVTIDYRSPDGRRSGRFQGTVRSDGTVELAGCGKPPRKETRFSLAALERIE